MERRRRGEWKCVFFPLKMAILIIMDDKYISILLCILSNFEIIKMQIAYILCVYAYIYNIQVYTHKI